MSFDGKCKIFGLKIVYIIGTIGFATIAISINQITEYEGILGLIYEAYFIVFSLIFLRGAWLKKLFISALMLVCIVSTAAVSGNILSALFKSEPTEIYTAHNFKRFTYMVIGTALLAYTFAIISRFTSGKKESLKVKEWVLIFSVLLISFLIIIALHITILECEIEDKYINLIVAAESGIVFINFICLYITVNLNETHKREEQLLIDKKRNEYSQQYAQSIKDQYEQTRRLRHDMKQYAATMQVLIKGGKFSEAEDLAEKLTENLSKIETVINVQNDFLNAILNSKLTFAKSRGIDILCSIENNISGVEDIDLCNLIGNLLDNAISAAEKCELESRMVEFKISSMNNKLVITVRNSILHSVLKENPSLKTTKSNSCNHGFGLKTIKYIAEKYNGNLDYYEDGKVFISRIELCRNEKLLNPIVS